MPSGADLERRACRAPTAAASRDPLGFPKRSDHRGALRVRQDGRPTGPATPRSRRRSTTLVLPAVADPFGSPTRLRDTHQWHAAALHRRALGLLPERLLHRPRQRLDRARCRCSAPGTLTDPLFPGRRAPADGGAAEVRRRPAIRCRSTTATTTTSCRTSARSGATSAAATTTSARYADYPGGNLNADPPAHRCARAPNDALNRFIDHYVKPPRATRASRSAGARRDRLAADLPRERDRPIPLDEPGRASPCQHLRRARPQHAAHRARRRPDHDLRRPRPNAHAIAADPVVNLATNGGRCAVGRWTRGRGRGDLRLARPGALLHDDRRDAGDGAATRRRAPASSS